jgi:hypothetical protein
MLSRFWTSALIILTIASARAATQEGVVDRLRRDLDYLTSDECEGRGAATQGIFRAADYIEGQFKASGLKPGGEKGTYRQSFRMQGGKALPGSGSSLKLVGPLGQQIELAADKDFRPLGFSVSGTAEGPVVFAGYGINHPESKYNDYEGVSVDGKIVIVLRRTPPVGRDGKPFGGDAQIQSSLGSLATKLITASTAKAKAVLFVNDMETAAEKDQLAPFDYTSYESPPAEIPCLQVTRSWVDTMLQASVGRSLGEIEQQIHRSSQPASVELKGWTAQVTADVVRRFVEVPNIIAIREGSGPSAKEFVIVGAHYDHLGRGERGSTERDPNKRNEIHRGADDNGSGTATVLELARRFARQTDYQGRTLVFMAFAGEEQGLLGSRHWCNQPTLPLDRVAAMLNFDMVGRLRPDKDSQKGKLEIGGVGTAKEFSDLLDQLNRRYDFALAKTESGYGPSDHESFNEKKIPVLFFFTGLHGEYHKPADTVATINFDGMQKILDFGADIIRWLATSPRPAFVQTRRPSPAGRVAVPRIGIMPGNYGDSDKGVLVGGVSPGGPAAKAGLKDGDVIVEIAGKPVKNMTAYMAVMGLQKKGNPVEIIVERNGQRVKLVVTPE